MTGGSGAKLRDGLGRGPNADRLAKYDPALRDPLTVGRLYHYIAPVSTRTTAVEVLQRFFDAPGLPVLPVLDVERRPIALIERNSFIEYFSKPYVREIHGKKTVLNLLKLLAIINTQPIIADSNASAEDVAQIIIEAGSAHMLSGFIVTSDGEYSGVANGHDLLKAITERRQKDLYYLAHYDHLTGLPNRFLLQDRLSRACLEANRSGNQCGLLFVDLDRFKQINDSLGHASGDALICALAERLTQCGRDNDTVARLGGDEFAIVAPGIKSAEDLDLIGERILEAMKEPFNINGESIYATASIGGARCPVDDATMEGLLVKADAAMYEAKRIGRNAFRRFVAGLTVFSKENMGLETELRNAVGNKELVLYYQPQFASASGSIAGVEALVRWNHPERGILSPAHFIEIAEQTGIIMEIGKWVLREACQQHCRWISEGMAPLRVAVNVSAIQFRSPDFCEYIESLIQETGMDPTYLEIELTESMVMDDTDSVLKTLKALKQIGIGIALDDFGTGYSSLSYLRQYPIDRLKVDQSFVRNLEKMPVNKEIIKAIIAMGRALSMQVVAEGVESGKELEILMASGCDENQGYHFCHPLPADNLAEWMAEIQAA